MPCTHVDYELYLAGVDEARLEGIRLGLEDVIAKLEKDAEEWERASKHYERGGNDKLADEASANAQVTRAYIRDIRAITPSDVLKKGKS